MNTTERLQQILLKDPTGNVRFFFALVSIGYGLFLFRGISQPRFDLVEQWAPVWVWIAALIAHGVALLYGSIVNKPSLTMYILEGWLGAGVWIALGLATTFAQGMPGPTMFQAFVACWILVRYPEWR